MNNVKTVDQANIHSYRPRLEDWHPECDNLKTHVEIKNKEIIVLDGQFHEDYDTLNYGPRDTVFMLFCMARDEKNSANNAFRFKMLSSHAILVRQVRDWIKKVPGTGQNQLPVRGTLVFEIPDHGPTRPMWFMR
jgi:hypothetical protein